MKTLAFMIPGDGLGALSKKGIAQIFDLATHYKNHTTFDGILRTRDDAARETAQIIGSIHETSDIIVDDCLDQSFCPFRLAPHWNSVCVVAGQDMLITGVPLIVPNVRGRFDEKEKRVINYYFHQAGQGIVIKLPEETQSWDQMYTWGPRSDFEVVHADYRPALDVERAQAVLGNLDFRR